MTPLLMSGVTAGLQAGLGLYQLFKGINQERNNPRPTYQIPEQLQKQLSSAELQALEGMPEQQRQNYIDQLMQQSASAISSANDRRGGLASIGTVLNSQNEANKNLLAMDAQARMQNMGNLQNVRTNYAQAEDKQFQLNQLNPFYERAQSAQAMKGAGLQNIMGSVQGFGQSYINQSENDKYLQAYKNMTNPQTTATTTPTTQFTPVGQLNTFNPNTQPFGYQVQNSNPFLSMYNQQQIPIGQVNQYSTDPNLINPFNPYVNQ